jgi:N-acetylmuramoyl-L-alanine amidase
MQLVTRKEWEAAPPRAVTRRQLAVVTAAVVHYADAPAVDLDREDDMVRAIQRYHVDTKGWDDIAYHVLVGMTGRLYQGRPVDVVGAHCQHFNTPTVGICFLTNDGITPQAGAAAVQFVQLLEFTSLHRKLAIFAHREKVHTHCPGDKLAAWVDTVRGPGGVLG